MVTTTTSSSSTTNTTSTAPTTTTTTRSSSTTTSTTSTTSSTSTSTTSTTTTAVPVPFIITVNTTDTGGLVNLPCGDGQNYSGTINWGDGEITANSFATKSHTYTSPGIYQITISGNICAWNTYSYSSNIGSCLTSIDQFGTTFAPNSLAYAFRACSILTSVAGDLNLAPYTSLYNTFASTGNYFRP